MPHYNNAPIVEALIDVQVTMPSTFKLNDLETVREKVKSQFPSKEDLFHFEMGFSQELQGKKASQFSNSSQKIGIKLTTGNKTRVMQLKLDGFTYSFMPPYTRWETLRDEFRSSWDKYVKICRPETITRCAIRYINLITIPQNIVEPSDYFNLYPKLPDGLSQDISAMTMRLLMSQKDIGAKAVITQALADEQKPNTISIVLDIDLFQEIHYKKNEYSKMFEALEKMRERKNEIFEGCITDKTRELFV